ncbi:MAG: lamin tail domain-containing protein, partial [Phycisphaerae bacterium]|nr:lamin tail domain-containing protein [Phycisphaerae bacterium]
GDGAEVCITRNIFQDSDYAILYKEDSYGWIQNNTFENIGMATVSFGEPYRDPPRAPGRGTYMDSNILWNNAAIWQHYFDVPADYGPTGPVYVYRSLLPSVWHTLGSGNIDAAPEFAREYDNLHLRPGSAGIGAGANGLDMGAYVPAGASISGEPSPVTWRTEADLTVGGPGITHYQYRVVDNNIPGDWSEEIAFPIDSGDFPADPYHIFGTIHLTGLQHGHSYRVDVRGKNSAGLWQGEPYGDTGFIVPGLFDGNRSRTWRIDPDYRRLVINEVLARNAGTLAYQGGYPNLIELYYDAPGTTPLDLGGMKVTDGGTTVNEYILPAGTRIAPGGYLVLRADTDTASPGIHLGFFLNGEGDAVKLYNASDELIDGVEFGFQTAGMSIGRVGPKGEWVLCKPTFGQANSVQPVREPRRMRINEWFAHGEVRFTEDFVELFNPEEIPVRIDGVCLTDNPLSEPTKFRLPALSFIGSRECIVLWSRSGGNANDLNFNLQTESGLLALLDPDGRLMDGVIYPDQTVDHSQGRIPDGSDTMVFFSIPTPGVSNPQAPTVVTETTTLIPEDAAKRVLIPTAAVDSAWKGGAPFDDSEWNSGLYIPDKSGGVGYEENPGAATNYSDLISYDIQSMKSIPTGSCYIRVPFTLTVEQIASIQRLNLKIRRDDAFIAYVNGVTAAQSTNIPANPAWNSYASASGPSDSTARQLADFPISDAAVLGALKVGENILAVHGMDASGSTDMVLSFVLERVTQHIEGNDDMVAFEALADGLRITELMYQPSAGGVEFVELKNIGDQSLNLKGVRFLDGIEYEFGSRMLGPGQFIVVAANVAAFQARYGTEIDVVGPYSGVFRDRGEEIVLALPDPYPAAILRFDYQPDWYPSASGGGHSLVIRDDQSGAWMWDHAEGWRASSESGGSPGREDPQ